MRTRTLDTSHDWTFGKNQSDYLQGSDAIKQSVLTAILSVRNDWFLNLNHGIDWVNYINKSSNLALLESDLKGSIIAVEGVYQITNIEINLQREQRKATISVEYTDIYNKQLAVQTNVRDQ